MNTFSSYLCEEGGNVVSATEKAFLTAKMAFAYNTIFICLNE